MKKLLLSGVAILGLTLACSQGAAAYTLPPHPTNPTIQGGIKCTLYPPSISNGPDAAWPTVPKGSTVGYVYQCGTASSLNTSYMFNALKSDLIMQTSGGAFYLFHDAAEANKALPQLGIAKGGNGATYVVTATGIPQYTGIVEVNGIFTLTQSQLTESTTHEEGHWIDDLGGGFVQKGLHQQANSALFTSNLAVDWDNVNALPGCAANGQGLLNGQADPAKYPTIYYVCEGTNGSGAGFNAGESGANNQAVIERLYQPIYNSMVNPNGEIYAEGFAVYQGSYYNDTVWDPAHFMYAGVNPVLFACTQNISNAMWANQAVPTTWPPNGGFKACIKN